MTQDKRIAEAMIKMDEAFTQKDPDKSTEQPCFCIGPQIVDGKREPACPCAMRQMKQWESDNEQSKRTAEQNQHA